MELIGPVALPAGRQVNGRLVFAQECRNRKEARVLEKYLKSGSGRELRDKLLE